jgi:uridine monophosphate synthetase
VVAHESFFARITARTQEAGSLLCVGLDPHPEFLATPSAVSARDFCLTLIEATADLACAFKPNSAFFEVFGAPGWAALGDVIAAVPDQIPVILDAKRGDIASTSRHYARAAFESLGADALTVSPYLGHDSIEPFLEDPTRGIFLLCKTSNPDSNDVQMLGGADEPVYLSVARLAEQWNERDNVGLVVGATDPVAIAQVRQAVPDLWILAPGVGPQGADPKAALEAGLRADSLGMLIPISRTLAAASAPREVATRFKDSINHIRASSTFSARRPKVSPSSASRLKESPQPTRRPKESPPPARDAKESTEPTKSLLPELADALLDAGCVKFGDFELKSGDRSPIYFDLRLLAGHPELLSRVADAFAPILEKLTFDRLAAVPYAGLPIATAIALQSGRPLIYPRKEVKDYGTGATVEGGFVPGETAVLIDDLTTSGGSKFEAVDKLTAVGLKVRDVVVLIDREAGARKSLMEAGLELHSVFTLSELIDRWDASGTLDDGLLAKIRKFLAR